jgi:AraC-like DNA-binding protein
MDENIAEFPHHHNQYEIYYVLEGSITIDIGGRIVKVRENHACILSKDIFHYLHYEPDIHKKYFAMIFDIAVHADGNSIGPDGSSEYADVSESLHKIQKQGYYLTEQFNVNLQLLQIEKEIRERKLGWNTQSVFLCYHFFITVLRQLGNGNISDQDFSGHENLSMSISKYIHKHYGEDINVGSVAEALHTTPRNINRIYQTMIGTTFMRNTNILRIAYAKAYLCKTDMTNEEIAERIGFSSSRVLYKLFKQYEGINISAYRKMHRL